VFTNFFSFPFFIFAVVFIAISVGTHSLIRTTMRMFVSSPVTGGVDLSWHDLYLSYERAGNHAEYSQHFIRSVAVHDRVTLPKPIIVPIIGNMKSLTIGGAIAEKDEDDEGDDEEVYGSRPKRRKHPAKRSSVDKDDEEQNEEDGDDDGDDDDEDDNLVVLRRLFYTKDPTVSHLDALPSIEAFKDHVQSQISSVPSNKGWHESSMKR
jgi:hypothetical protein